LFTAEQIKIYPNPCFQKLTIAIDSKDFSELSIKLFDLLGNLVFEQVSYNKQVEINVSDFGKGVYFVQLQNNFTKHVLTKK